MAEVQEATEEDGEEEQEGLLSPHGQTSDCWSVNKCTLIVYLYILVVMSCRIAKLYRNYDRIYQHGQNSKRNFPICIIIYLRFVAERWRRHPP